MVKHVLPLGAALAATFSVASAHADTSGAAKPLPGRDAVVAGKPDWCGDYEPGNGPDLHAAERTVSSDGYNLKGTTAIAQLACEQPNDPAIQKQVAAWRQDLINLSGMSARREHELISLRVDPDGFDKQVDAFCDANKPGDEASLEDKAVADARAAAAGCGGNTGFGVYANGAGTELPWWLDRRAAVTSEVSRAVFVLRCIRILEQAPDGGYADWPNGKNTYVMASFASCGPDARRLDETAFEAEIAQAPWTDAARANARETFALARATAANLTDQLKAIAAKDPAYQTLLFDAPEAGWKAWEAAYAANKAALEAALDYEAKFYGPSKKALLGCGAALRQGWTSYLAGKKPKSIDDARRAAVDEVGYVLLASLALCDAEEGRFLIAREESEVLKPAKAPIRRGPRLAAYSATLSALSDLLADRSRFPWKADDFRSKIDMPRDENLLEGAFDLIANKTMYDNEVKGTIGSIKKSGDGYDLTFKTVKTTIPNRICTPNGRILRIDDGGNVIYDSDCVTKGTVTLDQTPAPLTVPAEVGGALKAGQIATFAIDQMDMKHRKGFPLEAWQGDKLIVYLGAAL